MDLFGIFKKKTKEEKQKEENKIKLLAQIKELAILSESLIERLNQKYKNISNTPDKAILSLINKVKSLMEQVKDNLDDAYKYLEVLNIPYTINELVDAKKNVNNINESNLNDLIKLKIFPKSNKGIVMIIKSQVGRLIEDLPKFGLK